MRTCRPCAGKSAADNAPHWARIRCTSSIAQLSEVGASSWLTAEMRDCCLNLPIERSIQTLPIPLGGLAPVRRQSTRLRRPARAHRSVPVLVLALVFAAGGVWLSDESSSVRCWSGRRWHPHRWHHADPGSAVHACEKSGLHRCRNTGDRYSAIGSCHGGCSDDVERPLSDGPMRAPPNCCRGGGNVCLRAWIESG